MAEPDLDAVRADAVMALRLALDRGSGVAEALRWCYYRNPLFMWGLFRMAVALRFGTGGDIREITKFVARIRAERPVDRPGFPSREAELMIRLALGEIGLAAEADPDKVNFHEIGIAVLDRIFADRPPAREEVDAMFAEAEDVLRAARDVAPIINTAEDQWFGAGWHTSPFAVPLNEEKTADETADEADSEEDR